jgi:putative addiction module killer protein
MTNDIRELLLEDGSSPYADWFNDLPADVAAKVVTAKLRMQLGNLSNVEWFRGIGEYKIDFGAGWRIYLAKDGIQIIILLGAVAKNDNRWILIKRFYYGIPTNIAKQVY